MIILFTYFPKFYLKNWIMIIGLQKIAQDLTNSYQIYKNHPYENHKLIIIENLEP
jgi:hypothetical protein